MITVKAYGAGQTVTDPALAVYIEGAEDIAAFKKMVFQGVNLEPNTPAAIKEAADLILHGKVLQNYKEQK